MFYSKSENAFFDIRIHGVNMPSDAIEITKEQHRALLQSQSSGKIISSDAAGMPVAIDKPSEPASVFLNRVKSELRILRAPMLDAVIGIGWNASESGNSQLAAEARAIRIELLDITDDPALNAATTYDSMRAAGDAACKRIALSASKEFEAVFRGISGV